MSAKAVAKIKLASFCVSVKQYMRMLDNLGLPLILICV